MISNQHKKSIRVWTGGAVPPRETPALALLLVFFGMPIPHASAASITATGGTITDVWQNGLKYRVHTFTSSGTFEVTSGSGNVWYLVVAGGGGGGRSQAGHGGSAGGGAGGYRTNAAYDYAVTVNSYTVTVGAGGAGSITNNTNGANGNNSVFDTITSTAGGAGAGPAFSGVGGNGGSGGGSGQVTGTAGTGVAGQGFAGGGPPADDKNSGHGGGGASQAGQTAFGPPNTAGKGGDGTASSISGVAVTYAGGGGGGRYSGQPGGAGGAGGGGGGSTGTGGDNGTANTGGGGGGGVYGDSGGNGGSGIVIIRYPVSLATFITPMKSGLTGYWPFNQLDMNGLTALDRGGWGRNGTLANGPVATSSFMSGQAMSFASTSSNKITVSHAWSNFMSSTAGTISVWVKPTGNSPLPETSTACSPGQGIVAGQNAMYLYLCRANMSGVDSLLAGVYDGSHKRVSTPFAANQWTHLVWVRDSSKLYLYKNGVLSGSVSAGTTLNLADTVQIGQTSADNGSLSFDGSIDDVRVYSRTLTASEIKSLYQSTAGSKVNVSQNAKVTNGLVGLWSFDGPDIAGVTAYDRSGQGNNGTLIGGVSRVIGKLGQALNFDGVDDYASTSLMSLNSSFSVSLWAYTKATDNFRTFWSNDGAGASCQGDGLFFNAGQLTFRAASVDNSFNYPALTSKWTHIIAIYSPSNKIVYINGSTVLSVSGSSAPSSGVGFQIGNYNNCTANVNFSGKIDDVRIYNRALAPAEVKLLYNSGKGLLIR